MNAITDVDGHCCEMMARQVDMKCDIHADLMDCPDAVVVYSPRLREFGIPIRDGGPSQLSIEFCPWCGAQLPESQRDRYFDELEAKGFDGWEDNIPSEYRSDAWWRGG